MKEGETITEYFSRVMVVANDMRNLGEEMSDAKMVEKILCTLVDKFTYVVYAIEESKDIKEMTVDGLQSLLLVHEKNLSKAVREEHTLRVEDERGQSGVHQGRGRGGYKGGRGARGGRSRGSDNFNKELIECFKCHKMGHLKNECPTWKREANYAEMDEDMLLMTHVNSTKEQKEHIWFMDSGCSNHMCGTKDWFIQLDEKFQQNVKFGDDHKIVVEGRGSLRLEINGITLVFTSVYYVRA